LGFYTGAAFPEAYRGHLFVAPHGSWNRSDPVGYKVLHVPVEEGVPGPAKVFASG
jgi:glucose/arabinose dehydrogenase